ncbi:MAG: coenzyme F420-0:L-glutamate ligase [Chloroflexi bacterium]|nr:coenzyme F420-0:L-glutamate ligase [Chloroflexota bacterium]
MTVPEIRVIGVTGLPEIHAGDDLAAMMAAAAHTQGTPVQSGDVLVVTQKIISKAEGRVVSLATIDPSPFAESVALRYDKDPRVVELVLRESRRIVRMDQGVIITETLGGFICANAGIDTSNLDAQETVALLPDDSDRSASEIRARVRELTGAEIAVIVSDTFGRPWREGCTNVAIGVAGMLPLADYRGQTDPNGLSLRASVLAVADELASATELVMGKLDRIPAAIVRGYRYPEGDGTSGALVRAPDQDLFR